MKIVESTHRYSPRILLLSGTSGVGKTTVSRQVRWGIAIGLGLGEK